MHLPHKPCWARQACELLAVLLLGEEKPARAPEARVAAPAPQAAAADSSSVNELYSR